MQILMAFLMFLEIFVCALLLVVILIQRSKGQGIGMSFGSGTGEALFGAQMGNVLTRITVILAVIFLVNTLLLSTLSSRTVRSRQADAGVLDRVALPSDENNPEKPAVLPDVPIDELTTSPVVTGDTATVEPVVPEVTPVVPAAPVAPVVPEDTPVAPMAPVVPDAPVTE